MSPNHCRFSGRGSMMKRMNLSETIFLFFLALIIFGPKKLPEIARQIGKYMNEFKRASNEFRSQIEQEIAHLEVEKPAVLSSSPAPQGSMSRTLNSAPPEARSETATPDVPATLAASEEDEPLFASRNGAGLTDPVPATEAAAHPVETRPVDTQSEETQPAQARPDDVTSPSSQESHA
jgi:sec-independent protein translocase protein TatB